MDSLNTKKVRALGIIIHKMIIRYQRQHEGNLDEKMFELFEKAKIVKFAETEKEFQDALADL